MTHTPELLLKAQQLAYPGVTSYMLGHTFNPHDPTKGDLGALNEALERAGWIFKYNTYAPNKFEGELFGKQCRRVLAGTPAERAMKCVEVML